MILEWMIYLNLVGIENLKAQNYQDVVLHRKI